MAGEDSHCHGVAHLDGEFVGLRLYDRLAATLEAEGDTIDGEENGAERQ